MSSIRSYMYQTMLMGSPVALKLYQRCDETAKQVFALIRQWEKRLTVNAGQTSPEAELMAVNKAAGEKAVCVSPEVFALLRRAKNISLAPQSCFNFAIGPVVKAWNIGFAAARCPGAAELQRALALTNAQIIELNGADCSVFLPRQGMALDLGAIAKGFIADCVKDFLAARGVKAALINLGGNIVAFGAPQGARVRQGKAREAEAEAEARFWAAGLQKPFAAGGELLGLMHIADKSIVTSGIYERYFLIGKTQPSAAEAETAARAAGEAVGAPANRQAAEFGRAEKYETANAAAGKIYAAPVNRAEAKFGEKPAAASLFCHHIFDPQTGLPLHNDLMSVSIISEKSIDGEIWSSLLYGMGSAAATAFLSRAVKRQNNNAGGGNSAAPFGADLPLPPGLAAIFITKDRRILLPSRADFRFTGLDSSYRLCFYE